MPDFVLTRTIRIAFICLPVVVLAFIVLNALVIDGTYTIVWQPGKTNSLLPSVGPSDSLHSPERDLRSRQTYARLVGNEIVFEVALPRSFERLTAEIEYRNPEQRFLKLGVRQSPIVGGVAFQTVENTLLASANWHQLVDPDKNLVVLERKGAVTGETVTGTAANGQTFASVDDFLADLPLARGIRQSDADVTPFVRVPSYRPQPGGIRIDRSLRGAHRFITYLRDEPLSVSATFQDINRAFGADRFDLKVYRGLSELVQAVSVDDDGEDRLTNQSSALRTATVRTEQLPEGLYTIEISGNDDLVTRSLETSADWLVIPARLQVVDNEQFRGVLTDLRVSPTTLFTSGPNVTVKTPHPEGLQTIRVNNQPFTIDVVGAPLTFTTGDQLSEIVTPINDLILETPGGFVFDRRHYFSESLAVTRLPERGDFQGDFVVSPDLAVPIERAGWKTARADFDLSQAYFDGHRHLFVHLQAPGLEATQNELKLKEIRFTLHRTKLTWAEIRRLLGKIL